MTKRVCVIPGDGAAPEAVRPVLRLLEKLPLDIEYELLPSGEEGSERFGPDWTRVCEEAIDRADTTLFGSTSGKTPALGYLRWGKGTFANVRPVTYFEGAASPLTDPHGIDFVIVRENTEDLYSGVEGETAVLAGLGLKSRLTGRVVGEEAGSFALKVITESASRRIVQFGFDLAQKRSTVTGRRAKVTVACKYNMLPRSDGLFRAVAQQVASENTDVEFEDYIVDDFSRRIVAEPKELDVVVLPNLYGDILSDEAAALVGGLGMAPSGCYGEEFAYFEPVHGTAPDIVGLGIINPTATLLSAAMMLDYLGEAAAARALESAVRDVYQTTQVRTRDQGGTASSEEFVAMVELALDQREAGLVGPS